MLNTEDIKRLLIEEYKKENFKETGYNCCCGSRYVELRNVVFEVDKPYIFEISNIRMDPQWYVENYEPRINFQFDNLIDKIISNPHTRQACLVLSQQNELETEGFICTMYIHVFLDKISETEYDIEYCVHMRSNNIADFVSDILWNNKIFSKIVSILKHKTNWKLNKKNIVWCADTIHIYENNFDLLN